MSAIGTKQTSLVRRTCPLLGVKRTWPFALHMSAFDPKRTSADQICCPNFSLAAGRKVLGFRHCASQGGLCDGANSSHCSAARLRGRSRRAQQHERTRRIGVLMSLAADDKEGQARIDAFVQGLRELGSINGRNVQIDIRWARWRPRSPTIRCRTGRAVAGRHNGLWRQCGRPFAASDPHRAYRVHADP